MYSSLITTPKSNQAKFLNPYIMHCRFTLRLITAALGISCLFLYSCEKDDQVSPASAQQIATPAETYANMDDIMLEFMQDPVVRDFIRTEALKRITYDYEVIYGMVKHNPMTDGRTLEQVFLSIEDELVSDGRISGFVVKDLQTSTPLLSINVPVGIFDWNTEEYAPAVVLDPEANKKDDGLVEGYFADGRSQTFRAGQAHKYPVITLADNERMLYSDGKYELDRSLYLFVAPSAKGGDNPFTLKDEDTDILPPSDGGGGGGGGGSGGSGYDNCNRQFGHYVSLNALSMDNVSNFEMFGRPELRLNVLGSDGVYLAQQGSGDRVVDAFFNPDRNDVKQQRWDNYGDGDLLYRWESAYGTRLTFDWAEEDNGALFEQDVENIRVVYGGTEYSVTAPRWLKTGNEHIGAWPVYLDGCKAPYYGSSTALRWKLRFSVNP